MADTSGRVGDWMITASGKRFWPLDPREEEVDFNDIAHALAHTCRYGGHVSKFYSVAEHSVLLCRHIREITPHPTLSRRLGRWALLHDGAEAYFADVIRPVKRFVPALREIEDALDRCVWTRAGLMERGAPLAMPAALKQLDSEIIGDEARALFGDERLASAGWSTLPRGLGLEIEGWPPEIAEFYFKSALLELAPDLLDAAVPA